MRRLWVAILVFGLLAEWAAAAPITVPIYIEDSHAGSFYWLAKHLDLDEEFTLIHFDAHTDASGIFDSDKLRERLRRVGSLEERQNLLEQWRRAGVIQCFNWIEPLMPSPIFQVLWVHRGRRGGEEREARDQLDGHLEAAPRTAGSFREHYRVVEFDQLRAQLKEGRAVVVTIDLDYFANVPANRRAREFERVWKFVVECRNLRAVTIAISRPYLKSDEQADDLVRLAIKASLSLPTASIQFEPFALVGKDRSLRAREFLKRKEEVPAFKLADASGKLRALLLANRERITVRRQPDAWNEQLATWENGKAVRLTVRNNEPSTDNIWRVPIGDEIEVELQTDGAIRQIEWFALVPEYRRCNLTADSSEKSAFAIGAPPRPRWREMRLPGTDRVVSITREPGAVLVKARVLIDGQPRETAPIEIRRINGTGFRAALLEEFGLPYLFGSGQLRARGETGPETGFGADCANFVIYALRRQGYAVPWSNPKQLKKYLEPVAANVRPGESILNEGDIADGLIVHLGSHVAAVMEDRPPLGILDANDRVAHQLEGVPEILSLGQLLASRKMDRFNLWRVPKSGERIDLVMGGDVMLGRTIGSAIERGFDPLLGLRPLLEPAAARIVNLECVLSDKGAAVAGKRYCFRAPFDALRVLHRGANRCREPGEQSRRRFRSGRPS